MVLARLSALDRRLPFGTGTLVTVTAACVFVSGWTAAYAKGRPEAPPVASAPAPGKPDSPDDYLVDLTAGEPGYKRLNDRLAETGPMDLDDAAGIEAAGTPTDADRDALRELGFVRGHSRAWRLDETVFVVVVYEWEDTKAPGIFVDGVAAVTRKAGTDWTSPVRRSAGVCIEEKGGVVNDTVVAAVGKHSFLMVLTHDAGCGDHSIVVDLAKRVVEHATALGA